MRAYASRVWLYAWLSYRALFTFLHPVSYVSSLIAVPVFTGLLLTAVSAENGSDPLRPALGAAMLATANAVLWGTTFATLNERSFGTLPLWRSTPQHPLESLIAKSAVHVVNGLFTGAVTFALVADLADVSFGGRTLGLLGLCAVTGALASGGLALFSVSVSLWTRDALGLPNVIRALILVASGALVDPAAVFVDMGWLSPVLPLHHAIAAALDVLHGRLMRGEDLGLEIAVGLGWGTAGYALFRVTLHLSRRGKLLDLD
jgi:hypothetical protein